MTTHFANRLVAGICPDCSIALVVLNTGEDWPLVDCPVCPWVGATTELVDRHRVDAARRRPPGSMPIAYRVIRGDRGLELRVDRDDGEGLVPFPYAINAASVPLERDSIGIVVITLLADSVEVHDERTHR
jgi:hypothetical protein